MGRIVRSLALAAALGAVLGGCHYTWVELDSARYAPQPVPGLDAFSGMPLLLRSVDHDGLDTEGYYYYDRDFSIVYMTNPDLAAYFYANVLRALRNLGMRAYAANRSSEAAGLGFPALDLRIRSFNDDELRFTALLSVGGAAIYLNKFVARIPSLPEPSTPVQLEARAYAFVDAMVGGLLAEPGFQAAYFGYAPAPGTEPDSGEAPSDPRAWPLNVERLEMADPPSAERMADPDGTVTRLDSPDGRTWERTEVSEEELAPVRSRTSLLIGVGAAGFFPFGGWTEHRLNGVGTAYTPAPSPIEQIGPGGGASFELGGRWNPGMGLVVHLDLFGLSTGNWEDYAEDAGTPVSAWAMMWGAQALLFGEVVQSGSFGLELHGGVGYVDGYGEETSLTTDDTYRYDFLSASFAFRGGFGLTWETEPGCRLRLAADFLGGTPGVRYPSAAADDGWDDRPYLSVIINLGVWLTRELWQ